MRTARSVSRSLRARWVFPVAGPPLRDAAVTISAGRIVAVGKPPGDSPIEDLGQAAIVPGLVNAHAHLEFSDLQHPIGRPGTGFVEWLSSVIEHRADLPQPRRSSVEQGLRECVACGVTTIGEITQPGESLDSYRASPCQGTIFLELIAPRLDRVAATLNAAGEHIMEARRTNEECLSSGETCSVLACASTDCGGDDAQRWRLGLSPHAPYTVHPRLLSRVVGLSNECRMPLAMHLAESVEEIDFLRSGRGPFRDLLESRGAWDAGARMPGARPLDELHILSRAHRAVVIHGNYLDGEEIEYLARHRQQMAVVYCPRTHAWFGHARYPLEKMLAAGAIVALGTDSRASSPDLSLLAEMQHLAREFPALNRATILELGTLGGARALGLDGQIGTLTPGKWGNLAVIALPSGAEVDPCDLLFDPASAVASTWVGGTRVDR